MEKTMDSHLTEPNPALAEQVRRTPDGMAHWAGTGPDGATCAKCEHYGYFYEDRAGQSRRKPSACALYARRMQKHGGNIPSDTDACKWFEPASDGR